MSADKILAPAIHFLLNSQHRDGWWADFLLAPGPSNVWVTAYIGSILALQESAEARSSATRAWLWLSERESEGWGYNLFTPHDADSTLWALKLAETIGVTQTASVESGYRFLRQHVKPPGGVATYATDREIRKFIGALPSLSFEGWCSPQICVTASAAGIDQFSTEVCSFLRENQSSDGRWRSYWWCEDEYATTLAASALKKQNNQQDIERVERAIKWALTRVNKDGSVSSYVRPDGSPFALAWVMRLLSMSNDLKMVENVIERTLQWLKAQQQPNGSWRSSAGLRVPPPNLRDPEHYDLWTIGKKIEGGISLDQNGLFTTATVIETLSTTNSFIGV